MNKKKINILFLAFTCLFVLLNISCQKEDNTVKSDNDLVSKLPKNEYVKVNQGILEFSSWEAIEQTSTFLKGKSEEQKLAWEDKLGFRSLFGILYLANSSNEKMYEEYLNSGLTFDKVKTSIDNGSLEKYSEYSRKMIDENVLTERNMDGVMYLDIYLEPSFSLRYLNKEGIVAVNDTIYQYTINSIKKITDGDFSKLSIMKKANQSDNKSNVSVLKMIPNEKDNLKSIVYDNTYQIAQESEQNCASLGCKKLQAFLKLRKYIDKNDFYNEEWVTIQYLTTFKSFSHGIFSWNRDNQDVEGYGTYYWGFRVWSNGGYVSGYGGYNSYGTFNNTKANDVYVIRQETFELLDINGQKTDEEIWSFNHGWIFQYLPHHSGVSPLITHHTEVDTEHI